ncbi:MAG: Ig-like domain-containing protein, partial [Beijerinckiaceae bacterium]
MSEKSKAKTAKSHAIAGSSDAPDLDLLAKLMGQFASAQGPQFRIEQDASNRLIIILPNGEKFVFAGTQLLVQALAGRLTAFAEELRAGQVDIDRVLQGLERQQVDQKNWDEIVFRLDRMLSDVVPKDGSLSWKSLGKTQEGHLETPYSVGKIGRGIGHLPGLPGEDYIFGNDQNRLTEVARVDSTATDPRDQDVKDSLSLGGVGSAIVHLPPMPDGTRIIVGDRSLDPLVDNRSGRISETPRIVVYEQPTAKDDSYRVDENGRITARITDNDVFPNGKGPITLVGAPPPGIFELRPDGTFDYQPPSDFSGVTTFTYTFTDPVTNARVEAKVTLVVGPLADAPVVSAPSSPFTTDEDTAITLTGLSGTLKDTDGSEVITYRIDGVPPGSTFNGVGTNIGNGVWIFSAEDLASPLVFVPPTNKHGTFDMTFSAIATEKANGETAVTAKPFTIVVEAQADTPLPTIAAIAGNEDTPFVVGDKITWTKPDNDGSEWVSEVTIAALPAGWTTSFTANPAVTVVGTATTGYTISVSNKADEALLRALIDSFAVQAPPNSDVDATLSITVTTTDADGSKATSAPVSTPIIIAPVSDTPTVNTINASGEEDTHILFGDKITFVKPDNDGSEQISRVEITGFGSADVRNIATPNGPLTGVGSAVITFIGGMVTITGSEADIRATLDTLTVKQTLHSDADITLTINAQTTDGVAVPSANGSNTQTIVIDAQADAPTLTAGNTTISEDQTAAFGSSINFALVDNDGSERISGITISGFPADAAVAYTVATGAQVTINAGVYTITGDAAAIRATLDSFAVTPSLHTDRNFTLNIAASTIDADGSTATSSTQHQIIISAVADAPVISGTAAGLE